MHHKTIYKNKIPNFVHTMGTSPHIVVFTGAGVSAESGLKTFRDSDGLWENYNVMEVATPEAWEANYELVLSFYDQRRAQVINAKPNSAHQAIAKLEDDFKVTVVTQNIDDLHERAGSSNVLHLHGEILKSRSTAPPYEVYNLSKPTIEPGDLCPRGHQLRPHVVWFGEAVPMLSVAQEIVNSADIFIVIGTSLNVYPAASLVHFVPSGSTKYLIDPQHVSLTDVDNLTVIQSTAGVGTPALVEEIMTKKGQL